MHQVKVRRLELLQRLQENRETHIAEYEEASKGYHEEAIKRVSKVLDSLKAGLETDLSFSLPKPKSYEKEYDRVIEMVKMSVESELELSSQEFAQFVMDDWGWKQSFTNTNSLYSGR